MTSIGPVALDRLGQQRAEHRRHPAQPLEHLGAVRAVAQHLAEALVERAVGAPAGGRVLEHEHPHRGRDHPGHRADGAAVVAGLQGDRVAPLEERDGVLRVVDETLERGGAHQRAAQRAGGAPPTRSAGRRAGTGRGSRPSSSEAGRHVDQDAPARRARLHRPRVGVPAQRVRGHQRQVVGGALHRRAPVDPGDRHRLVRRRRRRTGRPRRRPHLGGGGGLGVAGRGGAAWRSSGASGQGDGPAGGPGVGQVDLGAGLGEGRGPGGRAAAGRPRCRRRRPRPAGRGPRPVRSRSPAVMAGASARGGVGLGAVAEHDVHEHAGGGGVGRRPGQVVQAQASGRSSGAPGPAVSASSPKSTIVCAGGGERGVQGELRGERDVAAHLSQLVAASSIASSQRVPPTKRPRRWAPPRRRGAGSPQVGQSGTGAPSAASDGLGRRGEVRLARRRAARSAPGCPASRRSARSVGGHLVGRRLGDDHDQLDRRVGVEASQRLAGRPAGRPGCSGPGRPRPARRRRPTPAASSRHISCWHPVPEAATMPTGPGRVALAKPRPTPPTIAVPQSGPITSRPRSVATSLSAISCSRGTLSLKIITSRSASRASIASSRACWPGTETSARSAPGLGQRAAGRPGGGLLGGAAAPAR